MKAPKPAYLLIGAFALLIIALLVVGLPNRKAPQPAATQTAATAPSAPGSVSGPGITLKSIDVAFPDDTGTYPDGPGADVINANCTACHSASMALYQPVLTADQWHAEVEKMRNTFKAPVAEKDVPTIVAYLTAMSDRERPGGAAPAPAVATAAK